VCQFGFNVVGYTSANLGLGAAARTTIRLLLENKFPVSVFEVDAGFGRSGTDRSFDYLKTPDREAPPYAINLIHLNPPECDALFRCGHSWLRDNGRLNVIVPFWELPKVPLRWLPVLERLDLILAPTRYIEHMMVTQVRSVRVRHYPQTLFMPDAVAPDRGRFGLPSDKVLFITSFEMLSDINRKNTWAAIEAFDRAFTKSDNAALVVNVNNPRTLPSFAAELGRLHACAEKNGRIILQEKPLSYPEVLALYASCDVMVSLHRAEGLGLAPMEAMFLGKPVIATDWSGNMDFMTDLNSCLVPHTLVPVNSNADSAYKPSYVGGDTVWADPDVGCASDWMRRLAASAELRQKIGSAAMASMIARHADCRKGEVFAQVKQLYENRCYSNTIRKTIPIRNRKLRVLFLNRASVFDLPGGDTIVMKRLKHLLEQRGLAIDVGDETQLDAIKSYDIVHCFNLTIPEITEAFAKKCVASNVPFVITSLQEDFPKYYHKAMAAWAWFKEYVGADATRRQALPPLAALFNAAKPFPFMTSPFAATAANTLFACGETEAKLLATMYPQASIAVVRFGSSIIETSAPAALFETTFNIKDFVLCVGRVEPRKNQLMLLYALEESDIPVVFADGGFTYQPDYIALCKQFRRRGRTVFTGRLSDELLVSAYHACRMHCLPSWYELPGLVSLESAAYGCPVVASSWGCLPDYLDASVAWCKPDDPASIRSAIDKMYESDRKTDAVELARSFTWDKLGDLTLGHYERVLQEHTKFAPELVARAETISDALTLGAFINHITGCAEKSDMTGALRFYDEHRKRFTTDIRELCSVDSLMEKLRITLQHTIINSSSNK
jgi:glycosyltransferase involved in cell wall biosynthesis